MLIGNVLVKTLVQYVKLKLLVLTATNLVGKHKTLIINSSTMNYFTALHGMRTRSSDEKAVRLSVCLSICQTRAL